MIRTGKQRHTRHGRSGGGHGPLALVPMIDMLTILVVYLLVHTADTEILPNTKNIAIPQSVSVQKPRETTVVTVTRDMLYVNGEAVVSVAEVGMNCPNDRYVNDGEICQAVAANLARIGVKINLQAESKATYFPKILSRNTSFYMLGWTPGTYD